MIAEMIHSASLIHDDVIDQSFSRRGKPSVNVIWNHKKVSRTLLFFESLNLCREKTTSEVEIYDFFFKLFGFAIKKGCKIDLNGIFVDLANFKMQNFE